MSDEGEVLEVQARLEALRECLDDLMIIIQRHMPTAAYADPWHDLFMMARIADYALTHSAHSILIRYLCRGDHGV